MHSCTRCGKGNMNHSKEQIERILNSDSKGDTKLLINDLTDTIDRLEKELAASRGSRQLSAVPSELLKKIEALSKIVPMPPKAITYENGVEIVNFVQDIIMPEYYNWVKRGIAG